jgi:hypothetical protein
MAVGFVVNQALELEMSLSIGTVILCLETSARLDGTCREGLDVVAKQTPAVVRVMEIDR